MAGGSPSTIATTRTPTRPAATPTSPDGRSLSPPTRPAAAAALALAGPPPGMAVLPDAPAGRSEPARGRHTGDDPAPRHPGQGGRGWPAGSAHRRIPGCG